MADPATLPALLEMLLGPNPEKWSATEHSRASALTSLDESVDRWSTQPAPAPVEYDETPNGMVARIGGHVVGVAAFALTGTRELIIEVAPAWRRLGLGTGTAPPRPPRSRGEIAWAATVRLRAWFHHPAAHRKAPGSHDQRCPLRSTR